MGRLYGNSHQHGRLFCYSRFRSKEATCMGNTIDLVSIIITTISIIVTVVGIVITIKFGKK